jgi:hypothetical protein
MSERSLLPMACPHRCPHGPGGDSDQLTTPPVVSPLAQAKGLVPDSRRTPSARIGSASGRSRGSARRRRADRARGGDRPRRAGDRAPNPRGEVKIVPEPAGTRGGYDDLRRAASREPLGRGLRPLVASIGDLARMAAALGREQDMTALRQLRILADLDRGRVRGIER